MERVESFDDGVYSVEVDGRMETVYIAGPLNDCWAFWNGRVFRGDFRPYAASGFLTAEASAKAVSRTQEVPSGSTTITAPMPATVVAIHVKPGDAVVQGQVVMLLEAMKMELPIRAPNDGTVSAVHRKEGELVQADAVLLDLDA